MVRNFCTYFDKNYLLRGLALYYSLLENTDNFKLWILCFDNESYEILRKLNYQKISLIKLSEFEDNELLSVKKERTPVEYYWTCTPSLPIYIFNRNPEIKEVVYLDADMLFYSSLNPIYEEFGQNSIMIIPHRYSDDQKYREKQSGIFNVSMNIFKRDENSKECLNWWRNECIKWCYKDYDDGKLGDQLYLNIWPEKFKNVCVLENEGADVASWNEKKYKFEVNNRSITCKTKNGGKSFPLIFYHFHATKIYYIFGKIKIHTENMNEGGKKQIFDMYCEKLKKAKDEVEKVVGYKFGYGLNSNLEYIKRKIKLLIIPYYKKLKAVAIKIFKM